MSCQRCWAAARWLYELSRPEAGPLKVSAWACDGLNGKAYKLGGDHYVGKRADAAWR